MGRERALQGLHEFIERYRLNPDHPVLQDFLATLRPFAPDPEAYDAFVQQWFFEVVVPEYRLSEARRVLVSGSDAASETWEVTVRVENAGTGRMPVEIAAVRGKERFDDDDRVSPDYRDARATVTLGAGEVQEVTIQCPFRPERVVVDPDALVFQLLRKLAVAKLE